MTLPSNYVEPRVAPRPLGLASCHVDRSRHYRITAKLLSAPPDDATLASMRALLRDHAGRIGEDRALRQLRAAMEKVWTAAQPDLRCDAPESWVLALASGTANVTPSALRTTELDTLAVLAEKTAWAVSAAQRPLYGSMIDLQRRLIEQHSGSCLGKLARGLKSSSEPFYGLLGLALCWRLEDDARLLALDAQ
jgi:TorA maturation chaperone TorD